MYPPRFSDPNRDFLKKKNARPDANQDGLCNNRNVQVPVSAKILGPELRLTGVITQ